MGVMKTIAVFAEEHAFDAEELRSFAGDWFAHVDCDQPLYAVLNAFRVMDENGIHESDTEAFMEFLALLCWDVEEAGSNFSDRYQGQWDSMEDFAENQSDESGIVINGKLVSMSDVRCALTDAGYHAPEIDKIAWNCDYDITRSGHVFSSN